MEIFQYDFMQRAFIVGILLSCIIPCIGTIVVLKRLSMVGDALAHTSLAGVAGGLLLGLNPLWGAVFACVLGALGIEWIRKKMGNYGEMSIAVMMSLGIGLAGLLSGYVKSASNFNSFLFGSIVSISDAELISVALISALVAGSFCLLYKELFFISFDERAARLAGVPVKKVNFLFTLLTALTISIACRTVGALVISSMMVLPVACAMQIAKSYRSTVLWAVCSNLLFTTGGLFVSYYAGSRPGATIVLTGFFALMGLFSWRFLQTRRLGHSKES